MRMFIMMTKDGGTYYVDGAIHKGKVFTEEQLLSRYENLPSSSLADVVVYELTERKFELVTTPKWKIV